MRKIISMLVLVLMVASTSFAQVTSSSITGSVKGDDNKFLDGATIVAVHTSLPEQSIPLQRTSLVLSPY